MSVMTRQLVGPSVGFCLDGWFELSYFFLKRQESYTSNAIIGALVNKCAFEEVEVIFFIHF